MAKLRLGVIGAGSWTMSSHLPNLIKHRDEIEFAMAHGPAQPGRLRLHVRPSARRWSCKEAGHFLRGAGSGFNLSRRPADDRGSVSMTPSERAWSSASKTATPTATVDQFGLGTVSLRSERPKVAFAILDAWRAAGGRLIDTAAVYGAGESERAIGAWLRARDVRDEVVLLTKGAHPDPSDWVSRMTPDAIEADLTASLVRLGVKSVDVYLVHRDDPSVPVGVILEALAAQVAAGRVRAYGVSNWTPARLDEALDYIEAHNMPPLAWSSSYFGLASPVVPSLPGVVDASDGASRDWYASHATRLVAWSPGGNGYFVPDADLAAGRFDAYRDPANLARRERAADLATRRGWTMSQVALAWVLSQPFAPVALIGTTSVAHLREALDAATIRLTEEERRWLEHGGDAVPVEPQAGREEVTWTS